MVVDAQIPLLVEDPQEHHDDPGIRRRRDRGISGRGIGVDALLFWEALCAGLRQGYEAMEISWVLESNRPMRQTAANFNAECYRTYRVYEKAL